MQRFFGGLLALFAFVGVSHAQSQADLLPVEQAFTFSYHLSEPGQIALHWDIAPDYYLYRERISAKTSQPGLTLGALQLPAGEPQHDEFFGDVEIYHGSVDVVLPYTLTTSDDSLRVAVTVQGCHEVEPKVCYPPHRSELVLAVPASAPNPLAALSSGNALQLGNGLSGNRLRAGMEDEALPAEQAFVFEAIAMGPSEILARWSMPPGYYLYRDKTRLDIPGNDDVQVGEPDWPVAVDHSDENFGDVRVYYNQLELPVQLSRSNGTAQTITLRGEFQGCKENGICYPVMQREVAVDLPAASEAELSAAAASFVAAQPPHAVTDQNALRSQPPALTGGALGLALLLALAGGVILNLMPCVLPVLSLKVLGLAQSGESASVARRSALFYTAGVLSAFAAVGLLAIALRAAGQALGWGFQLQQPAFVAVLVYVMFAVGLGLSGVFNFGAGLAGTGHALTTRSGPAGDFFTGVLACVVASPCTAPFMGPALAFAFAASPWVAVLIFLALGLGLALPFLLIGFLPALAQRLPRPGPWMDTFKQVLAFPMYLTAVWLVWVLGKQRGADAIGLVLVGAVVLALALWWFERARYSHGWLRGVAMALLLLALLPLYQITQLAPPSASASADDEGVVAYSSERLAALRGEGRTVFVNMTADWCATCKVNEKTVLGSADFRSLLEQHNAVYMKGDWTNVDPQITAFLEQHKSVGVPLYVVFHGNAGEGEVLPTVLTYGIVEQAMQATSP